MTHIIDTCVLFVGRVLGEKAFGVIFFVTQYLSPNSYTGEDLVELSCHGNPIIVSKIIALCLAAGASIAGPG